MILATLRTSNFRNLVGMNLDFDEELNLVVGDNGQGKTSLLEAIYVLATTKSFRTKHAASLFAFGTNQLFVEGVVRDAGIERTLSIGMDRSVSAKRRELLVNGQPATLPEFVATLPIIAFSSARLELLRGGPDERRRFLDRGLATLSPGYLSAIARYQRVLRQRNALLQSFTRRHRPMNDLQAWDDEWVETAAPIIDARREYVSRLEEAFARIVEAYRYPLAELRLAYRPSVDSGSEALGECLQEVRPKELASGFTQRGPHRDDLEMTLWDRPAEEILSAGETKIVVLFLKMAKLRLILETLEQRPVFLLDDVDAELDLGMIERILGDLRHRAQLFATSSKESVFASMSIGPFRKYRVLEGRIPDVGRGA